MATARLASKLRPHAGAAIPGLIAVALMLTWAVVDGGFDPSTWYWGALVTLAVLVATLVATSSGRVALSRPMRVALIAFGLYVAWSYLSITWAQYPGAALDGSNRALLYLMMFALLAILPWTVEGALATLVVFALGIGVIALVLLVRLASGHQLADLFIVGRLAAPTGYENATAALFTIGALVAIALASRRELRGLLRGLLMTCACADLQLALIPQSRGWLFTLPLVAVAAIAVASDRLRTATATIVPVAGAALVVRRLLGVFHLNDPAALHHGAVRAGHGGLLSCLAVLVAGTLLAWAEQLRGRPPLNAVRRRVLGVVLTIVAVVAAGSVAMVVSNGDPGSFIARQWDTFSHEQETAHSTGHFLDLGSGRYDVWRVALDAFLAHPIGGLGQDNFADYYLTHRHTSEELSWTHSLEFRLLAHTGAVGFVLFAVFLVAAIMAAGRTRRRGPTLTRGVAAAALMPLVPWLIHGSLDWFWEVPALTGPALGFLALAGRLGDRPAIAAADDAARPRWTVPRGLIAAGGGLALLVATAALAFPYLSSVEVNRATSAGLGNPSAALADLSRAADLNPLSSDPGIVGGTIALQSGRLSDASTWFARAVAREPGSWFGWLGAGLSNSARGDVPSARRDFAVAMSLNARQPAVRQAAARVSGPHPLTAARALSELVFAP